MTNKNRDPEQTVWLKWACDEGKQWCSVKGGVNSDIERNGKECCFSGCHTGHIARIVGETSSREEAHEWFKGC